MIQIIKRTKITTITIPIALTATTTTMALPAETSVTTTRVTTWKYHQMWK